MPAGVVSPLEGRSRAVSATQGAHGPEGRSPLVSPRGLFEALRSPGRRHGRSPPRQPSSVPGVLRAKPERGPTTPTMSPRPTNGVVRVEAGPAGVQHAPSPSPTGLLSPKPPASPKRQPDSPMQFWRHAAAPQSPPPPPAPHTGNARSSADKILAELHERLRAATVQDDGTEGGAAVHESNHTTNIQVRWRLCTRQ